MIMDKIKLPKTPEALQAEYIRGYNDGAAGRKLNKPTNTYRDGYYKARGEKDGE
jgi:hypothetical protein